MALVLVVHNSFSLNGTDFSIGDLVMKKADVDAVLGNPLLLRFCTWADHPDATASL